VAAVLLAVVVYVVAAWSARYPVIPLDEIVMVGNSRVIAGEDAWSLGGAGFMPGLAVLMAPVWWFSQNQIVVYQVGIWITVALALVTIWPLSSLAQRAGVSRRVGITIAAVVMMAPARALLSNYLVAESLLLLTTVLLVLAADRLWTRRRMSDAWWCGLAVAAVVLSHGRGVASALAAGVWLLFLARRALKPALVAAGTAVVLSAGVYALYRLVTLHMMERDARVDITFGDLGGRDWYAAPKILLGQLWYATAAWPAVAVVGALAVAWWARKRAIAAFLTLAIVLNLVLATVQLNPRNSMLRMDPWFYGRYMDHWWTILAVLGLAVMVRVKWPAMLGVAVAASALAAAGMLFITVPGMPHGAKWVDLHVLGVSPWLSLKAYGDGEEQSWPRIVAIGFALSVLVAVLSLMRAWVVPILATLWMWLSITHDLTGIDPRQGTRSTPFARFSLDAFPMTTSIGFDTSIGTNANLITFAAHPRETVPVDPSDPPHDIDVVYVSWFHRAEPGPEVALLKRTRSQQFQAWVFPGELADRLEEEDCLGPMEADLDEADTPVELCEPDWSTP
jgi:hypothetical protein